jgi:hypothetical protein
MLYAEWVPKVLETVKDSEDTRTRLVGFPVPALREPLGIDLADVDAIEDAVYDLQALGLTRRRPNSFFNLTPAGRLAATQSIEEVCGDAVRETCNALTGEERRFVQALMDLSQEEYDLFARLRYVNVARIFERIGLEGPREWEESFLLPLVEKKCINYQEFKTDRDARLLFTGVTCVLIRSR